MKRVLALICLLSCVCLGAEIFAQDTGAAGVADVVSEDFNRNEVYFNVGLPSSISIGSSFLFYVLAVTGNYGDEPYSLYFIKIPAFEVGYNYFFSPKWAIGASLNYECGNVRNYDPLADNAMTSESWTHNVNLMATASFLIPKERWTYYCKVGYGCDMLISTEDDTGPFFSDAWQICPLGMKFKLKNDYNIVAELNLGFSSMISVGVSKGF